MSNEPRNRVERRARGRRIGSWDYGTAFRRPSSRVRVHRVPFDPQRAQRPSSRLHGRTRYGQAEDERVARTGEALRLASEGLAKLSRSIQELRMPRFGRTGRSA